MARKFRTIFSLNVKLILDQMGFIPVVEREQWDRPGKLAWVYKNTTSFQNALDQIMGDKEDGEES